MNGIQLLERVRDRLYLEPEENSPLIHGEPRDQTLAMMNMAKTVSKIVAFASLLLVYLLPNIVFLSIATLFTLIALDTHIFTTNASWLLKTQTPEELNALTEKAFFRQIAENTSYFRLVHQLVL